MALSYSRERTFLLSSSAMMQPSDHMSTAVEYSF